MKDIIFREIDRLIPQMIEDLKTLVKIPSKRSEATKDAPFGKNCKKVLEEAIRICEREGLSTKNIGNRMVYGSYGKSDEYLAIIGHLDVVEEGEGWTNPPYSAHIENGKMYSRGALDNKGPIVAALYALLALKNLKIKPKREIRVIFGSSEETGMEDLDYYLAHEKAPVMGFTPDNKFPAIYGERGRITVDISGDLDNLIKFINEYVIKFDSKGEKLGISCSDKDFGDLLITSAKIINNEGNFIVRYVIATPNCDLNEILEKFKVKAKGLTVELNILYETVLKNKNSTNIKVMNSAYNEVMGQNAQITTTKGITYAHKCETIIPFGPSFPGQNGIAHLPDEWFDLDDMVKCAKIYAYALYKLNQVEEIEK